MPINGKMNGWLKFLGVVTGLILSMLALFFTMIKPAVSTAVADQIQVEVIQRVEAVQKNYAWGIEEHKQIETRIEKRLDRME